MPSRASGDATRPRWIVAGVPQTAALVLLLVVPAWAHAADPEVPPGRGAYIGGAPSELSKEEAARQLANPNTPLASLTLKNQWTGWRG